LSASQRVVDVFAGMLVSDYAKARPWYEQLLGAPPSFVAHETECVWELSDHGYVFINEDPARAGRSTVTVLVDDLDALVDEIEGRGIEPAQQETYSNGVRKATYRDADGNEIGFGGEPASS
jgi:catechol 2,3-dioxygenase-like lactoylglutathione lyase family enzyme